jgi:hypothetical protein
MTTKGLYRAKKEGRYADAIAIQRAHELERAKQRRAFIRSTKPRPSKKRTAAQIRAKREREYGPPDYHAFLTARPCCACGVEGFSEFAHVGNEGAGTSRKANASQAAPLCGPQLRPSGLIEGCHRLSHRGQQFFEAAIGIDLKAEAAKCWADFHSTLCIHCGSDVSCCGEVLCQQVSA